MSVRSLRFSVLCNDGTGFRQLLTARIRCVAFVVLFSMLSLWNANIGYARCGGLPAGWSSTSQDGSWDQIQRSTSLLDPKRDVLEEQFRGNRWSHIPRHCTGPECAQDKAPYQQGTALRVEIRLAKYVAHVEFELPAVMTLALQIGDPSSNRQSSDSEILRPPQR